MAAGKVKLHGAEARDGMVALRIPIDGRMRTFTLDPEAAIAYGNRIANTAMDMLGSVEDRLPVVTEIKFRPTAGGGADLALYTNEGPCMFHVPAYWLVALTQAAGDLLELRGSAGQA